MAFVFRDKQKTLSFLEDERVTVTKAYLIGTDTGPITCSHLPEIALLGIGTLTHLSRVAEVS